MEGQKVTMPYYENSSLKMASYAALALVLIFVVFIAYADEIELRISDYKLLYPNSQREFLLHIVNNTQSNIRIMSFKDGRDVAVFLIDSSGNAMKYIYDCDNKGYFDHPRFFTIYPGDVSTTFLALKDFSPLLPGLHYLVFAIPKPNRSGVIISSPAELIISPDKKLHSCSMISFETLPTTARNSLRVLLDERFSKQGLQRNSWAPSF